MRALLLEGPNLGAVGRREPETYGEVPAAEALEEVRQWAARRGIDLVCERRESEEGLVEALGGAKGAGFAGVVLNPGALSHSSYAVRDACKGCGVPVVEAHLSAVHGRPEEWRRRLVVAQAGHPVVSGLGYAGYRLALDALSP